MQGEYQCQQVPMIISIPDNTVKIRMIATVMEKDDSMREVTETISLSDISQARIDAEDYLKNGCWKE